MSIGARLGFSADPLTSSGRLPHQRPSPMSHATDPPLIMNDSAAEVPPGPRHLSPAWKTAGRGWSTRGGMRNVHRVAPSKTGLAWVAGRPWRGLEG